jgi:hypothetical protein
MHSVVNPFSRPVSVAACDAGFKVDHGYVWRRPIQLTQRVTPDVGEVHWAIDGAVLLFGKRNIVAGIANPGFEELWVTGMRQDLVDATSGHDITTQEEGYEPRVCCLQHRHAWERRGGKATGQEIPSFHIGAIVNPRIMT